jgi:hypothetical protein
MLNVNEITVGQEIGFSGNRDWKDGIGRVVKTNGHGHIFVEVDLGTDAEGNAKPPRQITFGKDGTERGEKYSPLRLCAADDIQARRERRRIRNESQKNVTNLLDEIARHRTGCGDYFINAETKAKIIELANALTVIE